MSALVSPPQLAASSPLWLLLLLSVVSYCQPLPPASVAVAAGIALARYVPRQWYSSYSSAASTDGLQDVPAGTLVSAGSWNTALGLEDRLEGLAHSDHSKVALLLKSRAIDMEAG